MSEIVDIVDKKDNVIGQKERYEIVFPEISRVVDVFILNSKGEILLQFRPKDSHRYPLHWDTSASGHVDLGESYDDCANREMFEEIGIKTDLDFLGKEYIELDDNRNLFTQVYKGNYDGDFNIDPKEVDEVKFFTKDEIKDMIKKGVKIHPECLFALEKYIF